ASFPRLALHHIGACRGSARGGQPAAILRCGFQTLSWHTCQGAALAEWVDQHWSELRHLRPLSVSITLIGPPLPLRSSLATQASCPCRTTSPEVVQPALCLRFRRRGRQREQRLPQNP